MHSSHACSNPTSAGLKPADLLSVPPAHLAPPRQPALAEAVWACQLEPERQPATLPTPVARPAASLQELIASLEALPGCRLQLLAGRTPARQPGEATAVVLRCGRAVAAVVHLQQPGGLHPLRVAVLSAAEADDALSGGRPSDGLLGAPPRSLWAPSQHAVFQQLAGQAGGALEHFLQRAQQGQATASPLEMLLLWLATCGDLFSQPAGGTSGGLQLAGTAAARGGLLPMRRPCDLECEQLWAAALNPHLRRAEPADEAGP